MEIIPVLQFPAMPASASRSAGAHGLRDLHVPGIKHQGRRLLQEHDPQDVPGPILLDPGPDRALSNVIVRPFTLGVRLFANMFAGHLLLLVFTLATWYLFSASIGLLFAATSFIVIVVLPASRCWSRSCRPSSSPSWPPIYIGGSLEAGH